MVFQPGQRLGADRVARHQPQDEGAILLPQVLHAQAHRLARHQRLAAAGRDAQANAGNARHLLCRPVGQPLPW